MSQISSNKILKEIKKLIKNPKPGFTILTNGDLNIKKLSILLYGPTDTPFENGEFYIDLIFTSEYPSIPPKGYFVTKIYHPNIDYKTGEICVNTLKKDWKPNYGIENVLISIRSLLILPNSDSALNADAGKLLRESYDNWFKQAKLFTKIHAISNKKLKKKKKNEDESDDDSLLNFEISDDENGNKNNELKSDGKISNKENSRNKKKKKIKENNDNNNNNNDDNGGKKHKKKHKSKKKKSKSALRRL